MCFLPFPYSAGECERLRAASTAPAQHPVLHTPSSASGETSEALIGSAVVSSLHFDTFAGMTMNLVPCSTIAPLLLQSDMFACKVTTKVMAQGGVRVMDYSGSAQMFAVTDKTDTATPFAPAGQYVIAAGLLNDV